MGQGSGNTAIVDDKTCIVWSKTENYKNKERKAIKNVEDMLCISKRPYISLSCGKDSTVLADIVLSINRTIPCRFISSGETRIIHNVDSVMNYFKETYNAEIEEIIFDRVFSEEWKNSTFDEQRKAGRKDIQSIDNTDYDGVFMGLRKQESRGRHITLARHQSKSLPQNMYKYKERNFYRMCPLADWKTEDIGAYIAKYNLPKLNWYEEYGYNSRTTARITGDAVRQNVILYLKVHNPQGYYAIVNRFPELRIYG